MKQLHAYAQSLSLEPNSFSPQLIIAETPKDTKKAKKQPKAADGKKKSTKAQQIIDQNKERMTTKQSSKVSKKAITRQPAANPPSITDILEYSGHTLDRSMDAKKTPECLSSLMAGRSRS